MQASCGAATGCLKEGEGLSGKEEGKGEWSKAKGTGQSARGGVTA